MDWVACAAVDWADEKHAYELRSRDGERKTGSVGSDPESFHAWIAEVRRAFPEGQILFVVEDGRPSLLDAVCSYSFLTVIRINPLASKRYRHSRRLSGSSSDPVDASLICDYAVKHLDELRIWKPPDAATRRISALSEERRNLVNQRTAMSQELTATLKGYFPQLLTWLKDVKANVLWQVVRLWPTLDQLRAAERQCIAGVLKAHRLRRVDRRIDDLYAAMDTAVALTTDQTANDLAAFRATALATILEAVDQQVDRYDAALAEAWALHPDHDIFDSLPGAGPVFGARLAAAFTTDRDRFSNAAQLQCFSGIAPVKESSGKFSTIRARHCFPKFIHQTFHEFAESSLPHCAWARASYRQHRERGAGHHAAVRAVAFAWIRIIFRIWKDNTVYDDALYVENLRRRGSPLAALLAA